MTRAAPVISPTLSTDILADDRQELPDRGPGFFDTVGNAIVSESIATGAFNLVERSFYRSDPTFLGVYSLPQERFDELTEGIPTDYWHQFDSARSEEQAQVISQQLRELARRRDRLAQAGGLGIAARLGAGFLDPGALVLGFSAAGVGAAITRGIASASRAGRIARVAGGTAAFEASIETPRALTDPEAGALDVALAGLVGGALGGGVAAFSRVGRGIDNAAERLARERELRAQGIDPDAPPAAMGSADPDGITRERIDASDFDPEVKAQLYEMVENGEGRAVDQMFNQSEMDVSGPTPSGPDVTTQPVDVQARQTGTPSRQRVDPESRSDITELGAARAQDGIKVKNELTPRARRSLQARGLLRKKSKGSPEPSSGEVATTLRGEAVEGLAADATDANAGLQFILADAISTAGARTDDYVSVKASQLMEGDRIQSGDYEYVVLETGDTIRMEVSSFNPDGDANDIPTFGETRIRALQVPRDADLPIVKNSWEEATFEAPAAPETPDATPATPGAPEGADAPEVDPNKPTEAEDTPPPPPGAKFNVDAPSSARQQSIFRHIRASFLGRLENDDNATMRQLARLYSMGALPIIQKGAQGLRRIPQAIGAHQWVHRHHKRVMTEYSAGTEYLRRQYNAKRPREQRRTPMEWQQQIHDALANPAGRHPPEISSATGLYFSKIREVAQIAKANKLPGADQIKIDPEHLPRQWDFIALSQIRHRLAQGSTNTDALGQITELFADSLQTGAGNSLSRKDAITIARAVVERSNDRAVMRDLGISAHDMNGMLQGQKADKLSALVARQLESEGVKPEDATAAARQIVYDVVPQPDQRFTAKLKHRINLDMSARRVVTDGNGNQQIIKITDFYANDAYKSLDSYTHGLLGETAAHSIYRKMADVLGVEGGFDSFEGMMEEMQRRIAKSYADNPNLAPGSLRSDYLTKRQARHAQLMKTMDLTLRGVPLEPSDGLRKMGHFVRMVNLMIDGGGFGLAQMPELAMAMVEVGATAMIQQMPILRRIFSRDMDGKLRNKLLSDLEAALGDGTSRLREYLGHTISREGADQDYADLGRFERGVRGASKFFNSISGLSYIHMASQRMAGAAAYQRIVNLAQNPNKIPSAKRLSAMNMTEDSWKALAARIRNEIDSKSGGIELTEGSVFGGKRVVGFNPDKFADPGTADEIINMLETWSHRVIQENDIGSMIPWLQTTEFGKVISQFQTFHLVSYEKQLLHSIVHADGTVMAKLGVGTMVGSLVYWGQTYERAAGRDDREEFLDKNASLGRIIRAGIQRSGMSSVVPQTADLIAGMVGADPMFNARNSRLEFSGENPFNVLANHPTGRRLQNFSQAFGGAHDILNPMSGAELDEREVRAAARMALPLNLPGMTAAYNGLVNVLDLPSDQDIKDDREDTRRTYY